MVFVVGVLVYPSESSVVEERVKTMVARGNLPSLLRATTLPVFKDVNGASSTEPSTTDAEPSSSSSNKSSNAGLIAGLVVACAVAIVAVIAVLMMRSRSNGGAESSAAYKQEILSPGSIDGNGSQAWEEPEGAQTRTHVMNPSYEASPAGAALYDLPGDVYDNDGHVHENGSLEPAHDVAANENNDAEA